MGGRPEVTSSVDGGASDVTRHPETRRVDEWHRRPAISRRRDAFLFFFGGWVGGWWNGPTHPPRAFRRRWRDRRHSEGIRDAEHLEHLDGFPWVFFFLLKTNKQTNKRGRDGGMRRLKPAAFHSFLGSDRVHSFVSHADQSTRGRSGTRNRPQGTCSRPGLSCTMACFDFVILKHFCASFVFNEKRQQRDKCGRVPVAVFQDGRRDVTDDEIPSHLEGTRRFRSAAAPDAATSQQK